MSYVARWFVKKSITTRNALILAILDSLKKVEFKGLDASSPLNSTFFKLSRIAKIKAFRVVIDFFTNHLAT